ncbi:MAG: LPS export ABC transporter ATP-binding protein [Firmicutes bacterium]|jgi:lipopolysaccharide export system ATP-binding protein|nr:LPS export ABC transporter ATP-binding protein [Bacillota bacterium]
MAVKAAELVKAYHGRKVVNEVSLEVNQGEVVGLLGPNGAGKTTTFYMIVGLERPDGGCIYLNGEDITSLPMHLRAQRGLGYLPQEASVFRKLSVEENIRAVLQLMDLTPAEQKRRLEQLLHEFDLERVRHSKAFMLSGGERRRTEIARALATNPAVLLLDEPFAGVDPIAVADLQNIIAHLKGQDLGILITDHNVRETLSITDRAYIMHEGKILVSGSSIDIANDETARKFYLGERFSL